MRFPRASISFVTGSMPCCSTSRRTARPRKFWPSGPDSLPAARECGQHPPVLDPAWRNPDRGACVALARRELVVRTRSRFLGRLHVSRCATRGARKHSPDHFFFPAARPRAGARVRLPPAGAGCAAALGDPVLHRDPARRPSGRGAVLDSFRAAGRNRHQHDRLREWVHRHGAAVERLSRRCRAGRDCGGAQGTVGRRRCARALAGVALGYFKASSVLALLSVGKLMTVALRISNYTFKPIETLTAVGAVYLALGYFLSALTYRIERLFGSARA